MKERIKLNIQRINKRLNYNLNYRQRLKEISMNIFKNSCTYQRFLRTIHNKMAHRCLFYLKLSEVSTNHIINSGK
jgi:hypothetical protein